MAGITASTGLGSTLWAGLVGRTPDPAAAEAGLRRFVAAANPAVRLALERDAALVEALLTILANSEFLTEALVQTPELLLWLDSARRENRGRARDEWATALAGFTAGLAAGERAAGLSRFRRREYLRIVWRDLQGLASLAETTQELSHLADAILEQAYAWSWNDQAGRFGTPYTGGGVAAELAVLGLGKLGGEELNYNSDIDLMFIYTGPGETAGGSESTSNREFFTRVAQGILQYVSGRSAEGMTYKVDLRLRPGGREGELALGLEAAVAYYHEQARDWELQMLIRARGCAGARRLARAFLSRVQDGVYPETPDPRETAEGVRLSRQRISAQLERHRATGRRGENVDVKLDAGGIRDIEFLVQYLQRLYGGADPWVHGGNTLVAMQRLHDKRRLAPGEFQLLSSSYWLLRQIEHRVQLRLGQQTHRVPEAAERLCALARSLALAEGGRQAAAVGPWLSEAASRTEEPAAVARAFRQELERRMDAVREVYNRYLGEEATVSASVAAAATAAEGQPGRIPPVVPGRHGRRQWERLLRSAATLPEEQPVVEGLSERAQARLAIALEQSDWMAETLIRRPALAAVLEPAAEVEAADPAAGFGAGMAQLRRWRQQSTLRQLIEEWERRLPITETLAAQTRLATAIIQTALEMARRESPPAGSLTVLGLGRLGMGELDVLSDLDLVFVAEESEREAATRLTTKLIEALTAYTQQGNLYMVDTRLRPAGREGELVQTPASLSLYFEGQAGAWEAFSYLKAAVVAGNTECGARTLAAVRQAMGRRFSGNGLDRNELAALRERMRLAGRPGRWGLKTRAGGYYDIDFLVSRRLLESGRTAFESGGLMRMAQTMGQSAEAAMPPAEAERLSACVRYLRTADHALRVATGKAGSAIPASGEAVDRANAWMQHLDPSATEIETGVEAACGEIRSIYRRWE